MAASVTWTGGGDGTSWSNSNNWSGGAVPGTNDDVTIGVIAGNPTIQVTSAAGVAQIKSLTSSQPINITGGTLQVATTFQTSRNVTLAGGTIKNGTVTGTGGAGLTVSSSGTLDGVTLNANLTMLDGDSDNGILRVRNGLTLNNATVTLRAWTRVLFDGASQTLGGTGTVVFTNAIGQGLIANANNMTLTFGAGILIRGGNNQFNNSNSPITSYGSVIGSSGLWGGGSNATIVNLGTINADTSGMSICINPSGTFTNQGTTKAENGGTLYLGGSWTNSGTLNVNASTLNLGGSFTLANLGTITRTGGTVNVTGILDNTGTTLNLNAASGSWNLAGGTIKNGTVTGTGGAGLTVSSSVTLDGVTLGSDLTVANNGNLYVKNGLTLNNAKVILNSGGGASSVYFQGTQTLGGTGEIVFTGNGLDVVYAQGGGSAATAAVLTLGSGILVHGTQGGYLSGSNYDSIINQGTINADTSGQTISVGGGATWTNNGTLKCSNGGILGISGTLDNTGKTLTLSAANGGVLLGSSGTIKGGR